MEHCRFGAAWNRGQMPVFIFIFFSIQTRSFCIICPTQAIFHILHVQESISNPDRKLTNPGFTPEGADEHIHLNSQAMANIIAAAKQNSVRRSMERGMFEF
jgi:hypothetical protein